jgi:class 3 adenylate cyclase
VENANNIILKLDSEGNIIFFNEFAQQFFGLWGDTVNTASRMESHSLPACIQVTSATYQILEDKYLFESRGIIEVKG